MKLLTDAEKTLIVRELMPEIRLRIALRGNDLFDSQKVASLMALMIAAAWAKTVGSRLSSRFHRDM